MYYITSSILHLFLEFKLFEMKLDHFDLVVQSKGKKAGPDDHNLNDDEICQ